MEFPRKGRELTWSGKGKCLVNRCLLDPAKPMGHRAKGANVNDKNQESFREEEAFELKCKSDGMRGK